MSTWFARAWSFVRSAPWLLLAPAVWFAVQAMGRRDRGRAQARRDEVYAEQPAPEHVEQMRAELERDIQQVSEHAQPAQTARARADQILAEPQAARPIADIVQEWNRD